MRLFFLALTLLGLTIYCVGQPQVPRSMAAKAVGTYSIHRMISYAPPKPKVDTFMPHITAHGDTLSAIVVVQAHANNQLRLNFTQYFNRMTQLSYWMGDMSVKEVSPNTYDLYLGTTKMGRIDHEKIVIDFGQDVVATKTDSSSRSAHMEGIKQVQSK